MTTEPDLPELLDETQTSGLTRKAKATLTQERWLGKGLPYYRIGRRIYYAKADIQAYLDSQRVVPSRD